MKTTKNMRDIKSRLFLRCHNVGSGGVDVFGSTFVGNEGMRTGRIMQELVRTKALGDFNKEFKFFAYGDSK